jgi:hypothetical protein
MRCSRQRLMSLLSTSWLLLCCALIRSPLSPLTGGTGLRSHTPATLGRLASYAALPAACPERQAPQAGDPAAAVLRLRGWSLGVPSSSRVGAGPPPPGSRRRRRCRRRLLLTLPSVSANPPAARPPPSLIEQGHGEPLHFETTAQHLARELHASREEAARLQRQLAEAQRAAAAADAALRRLEQQQQEQAAAARRQEEQSRLLSSRAGEAEQRLQQSQQALQEVSGEGLNQFSGRKGLCGTTCPA